MNSSDTWFSTRRRRNANNAFDVPRGMEKPWPQIPRATLLFSSKRKRLRCKLICCVSLKTGEDVKAISAKPYPVNKPIVAAINGVCMAAGFELMLGTDIRICAEHAVFGLPEVKHGLIPFAGSMARLPTRALP